MKATLEFDLTDLSESTVFRKAVKANELWSCLADLYRQSKESGDIEWQQAIESTVSSWGLDINEIELL